MLQLLDIISPNGERPIRHHNWGHIGQPVKPEPIVDTIQQTVAPDTVDTIANGNAVTDSLSQSSIETMVNNLGTGSGSTPSMFWTMFFVILALAICLYLVFAYRRHLAVKRD